MTNQSKVAEDTASYLESKLREDLLAEIPAKLVEKARNTGKGYRFKVIQDRSRKTNRVRRSLSAKKFFLQVDDVLHYKRDPKIRLKVVSEGSVEMKQKKGAKPVTLTFATAAQRCDIEVRGEEAAKRSPVAWQHMFLKEDPVHGMETLANRRDRIVDEQIDKQNDK